MSTTYLNVGFVTETCCHKGCNLTFAFTRDFYDQVRNDPATWWYCPAGHSQHYTNEATDAQKLARAAARETALKDQLTAAVRDAEDTRVALLRDRQRFANGVCPCCNRSFENVARHMRGEHPDYDVTKVKRSALPQFNCSCGRSFESLRGLRTHQGHVRRGGWDQPGASRWSAHLTKVGSR